MPGKLLASLFLGVCAERHQLFQSQVPALPPCIDISLVHAKIE